MTGLTFFIVLVLIGLVAGIVSAAAGLASLVSYPALLAMGLPPVIANVTSAWSTVGSGFSSVFASARELRDDKKQMFLIIPFVFVGSIIGAIMLFVLPGKFFQDMVPVFIGIAGLILISPHHHDDGDEEGAEMLHQHAGPMMATMIGVFCVGVYAGFFNAGAGVMMLTLLSVVNRKKSFAVNNALKNVAMTVTNTMAVIIFAFEAKTEWAFVIPLFLGNVFGGILGPIIVRHLPDRLMKVLVGIGALILAISLTIRNFA
ncbi:MAG: sulfite exporter TauE/SafE family protein [Limosilactobacillus sp.]|uniref:sulfite exporter TauE/SafE family protein n=1 Tax=Limosilactobacillus sp. TaxID=2773925 RepID=UPI002711B97C|nr:sulfite exporter TauE/SafE family protein [Limosilactobacillus sp.]